MRFVFALLLLSLASVSNAQGRDATNRYVQMCVEDTNFCAIAVLDTYYSTLRIVVKEAVPVPDDLGIPVQVISAELYDYMQKYAVLDFLKSKEELAKSPEEREIDEEIIENTSKCILLVASCGVGIAAAVLDGGISAGLGYLACTLTVIECKQARRANIAAEARRQALLKKIKEEREKQREANGLPPQPEPLDPTRPPPQAGNPIAVPLPSQPIQVPRPSEIGMGETPPGGGPIKPIRPKVPSKT